MIRHWRRPAGKRFSWVFLAGVAACIVATPACSGPKNSTPTTKSDADAGRVAAQSPVRTATAPSTTPPALNNIAEPTRRQVAENGPAAVDRDSPTIYFEDVTAQWGVDFSYNSGRSAREFAILESLGGGVGVIDFDRDGHPDLMFAGGGDLSDRQVTGTQSVVYRNTDGRGCTDVSTLARFATEDFYTHGVYPADFDADGFPDVAVSGYGAVQLFNNLGDGTFARLPPIFSRTAVAWSSSLAWCDLNHDGLLDLYVAHYVDWSWEKHPHCNGQGDIVQEVCPPQEFAGLGDAVYISDGIGLRRLDGAKLGLAPGGKGLGVVAADLNADGLIDLYVANDTVDNFLYLNRGNLQLEESATLAGVSGSDTGISTGSMGVCVVDGNQDGQPDIWVTNFERELSAYYRNDGGELFTHASRSMGFASLPAGFVGFGTVNLDFDGDGDEDLFVTNGHVLYAAQHAEFRQAPLAYENMGSAGFRPVTPAEYFKAPITGRGLAKADLNGDRMEDLIYSNLQDPAALLLSTDTGRFDRVRIQLVGTRSNRDGLGAVVEVLHDGARTQSHFIGATASYLSASDTRITVRCPGDSKSLILRVGWPGGAAELFDLKNIAAECQLPTRDIVIREGTGMVPESAEAKPDGNSL